MLNSKGSAIMALELPINSVLQIELSGKGEWMVTVKKFQAQFLSPEKVIMWLAKSWWAGRGGFALFVCCSPLAIHRANFCLWFWGSRKKCLCSLEIIEQFWHCCCNQINILSRFVSIVPVQGKCKISPCSFLHPSACPSMLLCGKPSWPWEGLFVKSAASTASVVPGPSMLYRQLSPHAKKTFVFLIPHSLSMLLRA